MSRPASRRIAVTLGLAFVIALTSFPLAHARSDASTVKVTTRDGFALALAPYRFAFPRDHAAHDDYQTEWWYYTGHLTAADGRRFGYELTFFRFGLRPGDPRRRPGQSRWRGTQLYPAHFAITDERTGRFVHVERFAREALGAGGASTQRLDVHSDAWTLRGSTGRGTYTMRLHAAAQGDALDLVQTPEKPPAIHGRGGVSQKAACASCASHYYSFTRLASRGTLRVDGTAYAVGGISWMDHEFGSSELQANQAGWDWFSIQLDDRREVMLYRLRQKDGTVTPQSSGSVIARDGTVSHVLLDGFNITPTGSWKSPHTGGTYPSGWHVRIPSANLDLTLTPTLIDQELANASGVSYWEGSVDATDARGVHRGVGYVELTGYAGAVSF